MRRDGITVRSVCNGYFRHCAADQFRALISQQVRLIAAMIFDQDGIESAIDLFSHLKKAKYLFGVPILDPI